MPKQRKFTSIQLSHYVNVSSSLHYHFDVWFIEWNDTMPERRHYYWSYGDTHLTPRGAQDSRAVPQYVIAELLRLTQELHQRGELVFFEYDREGNKRYEDLRYHDAERWASMVGA